MATAKKPAAKKAAAKKPAAKKVSCSKKQPLNQLLRKKVAAQESCR
jgi:hypothetical protein